MFDPTPFIDNAKKEIEFLEKNFSEKELSFFIFSGYYINSQRGVIEKIVAGVNALSNFPAFKGCSIEFYYKRNEKFRLVALYGTSLKQNAKYLGQSIEQASLAYSVLGGDEPYKEDDNPAGHDGKRLQLLRELNVTSSVYYPIGLSAIMAVSRSDKKKFTKREKEFILHFIKINLQPSLFLAMENETNIERAIRDPMTQLYNHTFFKMRLKEEAAAEQRGMLQSLSLVMIDIDFFKHYNDTNGHPKGDVVIKAISDIIRRNTRSTDIAARYGGEEFAILMPNAGVSDAVAKAEAVKRAVESAEFENEEKQPNRKVTISVGVATMPLHALNGGSLLENADKALYFSKEHGKNKVSVYGQEAGKN